MTCSFCNSTDRPVTAKGDAAICEPCARESADRLMMLRLKEKAEAVVDGWIEENRDKLESRLRAA